MAKFCGKIGFAQTGEDPDRPGIWLRNNTVERTYYGEWTRYRVQFQTQQYSSNADENLVNELSIKADSFADANRSRMIYIIVNGEKWKITAVQPQYPRLILTIGGLYADDTD